MSLGLVNSRVEFRFSVGSGPVVITSDHISLYTWHTLRFRKHRNIGLFFSRFSSCMYLKIINQMYCVYESSHCLISCMVCDMSNF